MLNPDIPPDQLERIRSILELLLGRLRSYSDKLPPQSDSALIYPLVRQPADPEADR
jgi:hypothetical protein